MTPNRSFLKRPAVLTVLTTFASVADDRDPFLALVPGKEQEAAKQATDCRTEKAVLYAKTSNETALAIAEAAYMACKDFEPSCAGNSAGGIFHCLPFTDWYNSQAGIAGEVETWRLRVLVFETRAAAGR
jgi:hypothetical protein